METTSKRKSGTTDLTVGKPLFQILRFALPLVLGTLFQQLYSFADTVIVGRCLGTDALGAVGTTYSLNFLILGFVQGACVGFGIPVAETFGAKDKGGLRKYLFNGALLCVVLSVVFTIFTTLMAGPLLQLIHTPEELYADAVLYIRIIFLGIPATVLYNYASSVLRAMGDSQHPFYFLLAASVLNIGLDYLLIVPMGMGVDGAAIATVLSQLLSGGLCAFWFFTRTAKQEELTFRGQGSLLSAGHCKRLAYIGFPMGFEYSVSAIGAVIMQDAINLLGSTAVAAQTAGEKIRQMFTLPMESVGMAMATYGRSEPWCPPHRPHQAGHQGRLHDPADLLRGRLGRHLLRQALCRGAGAGRCRPRRDRRSHPVPGHYESTVLLPWPADDLPQHAAGPGLQRAGHHFRRGRAHRPQPGRPAGRENRPGLCWHLPFQPLCLGPGHAVLHVHGAPDAQAGRLKNNKTKRKAEACGSFPTGLGLL